MSFIRYLLIITLFIPMLFAHAMNSSPEFTNYVSAKKEVYKISGEIIKTENYLIDFEKSWVKQYGIALKGEITNQTKYKNGERILKNYILNFSRILDKEIETLNAYFRAIEIREKGITENLTEAKKILFKGYLELYEEIYIFHRYNKNKWSKIAASKRLEALSIILSEIDHIRFTEYLKRSMKEVYMDLEDLDNLIEEKCRKSFK